MLHSGPKTFFHELRGRKGFSYEMEDKRPYILLLDSGISDDMGIRAPELAFMSKDLPASLSSRTNIRVHPLVLTSLLWYRTLTRSL